MSKRSQHSDQQEDLLAETFLYPWIFSFGYLAFFSNTVRIRQVLELQKPRPLRRLKHSVRSKYSNNAYRIPRARVSGQNTKLSILQLISDSLH
jgi:hypothetical protein